MLEGGPPDPTACLNASLLTFLPSSDGLPLGRVLLLVIHLEHHLPLKIHFHPPPKKRKRERDASGREGGGGRMSQLKQ